MYDEDFCVDQTLQGKERFNPEQLAQKRKSEVENKLKEMGYLPDEVIERRPVFIVVDGEASRHRKAAVLYLGRLDGVVVQDILHLKLPQ